MIPFDLARWTAYGKWATASLMRRYAVHRLFVPTPIVPEWTRRSLVRDESNVRGYTL